MFISVKILRKEENGMFNSVQFELRGVFLAAAVNRQDRGFPCGILQYQFVFPKK